MENKDKNTGIPSSEMKPTPELNADPPTHAPELAPSGRKLSDGACPEDAVLWFLINRSCK